MYGGEAPGQGRRRKARGPDLKQCNSRGPKNATLGGNVTEEQTYERN
jgi:hypothetical protein